MRLPESFLREGLELAKGCTLFGIPLQDLTREELMAAAAKSFKSEQAAREDGSARLKFFVDLMGRK